MRIVWAAMYFSFIGVHRCSRTKSGMFSKPARLYARFLHMKKSSAKNDGSLYYPKTENQKKYVEWLENKDVHLLVVNGPAGTGKTLFACTTAIKYLKNDWIHKIIITRPVVPVEEEELGFLPGDIKRKMDPWTRPIFDILLEHYSQREIDAMINAKTIEICPLAYMRGRTFKRSFIIADEMQNSSPTQMKMATTRIGKDSKMVVTGDISQTDMRNKYDLNVKENGLSDIMKRIRQHRKNNESVHELIQLVELGRTDVERSEAVVQILNLYDDSCDEKNSSLTTIPVNDTSATNTVEVFQYNHTISINSTKPEKTKKSIKKPGYKVKIEDDAAMIPLEQESIIRKYWWDLP